MGVLCLLCAAPAAAGTPPCTKTFIAAGGVGNLSWHLDENWNPYGVPSAADVACILEAGFYQVVVTQPVTVAGLVLDSPKAMPALRIIGTDFTLDGPGFAAGNTKLKVNDGAVLRSDTGGVVEVHSKLVIEGGVVETDVELYGHLNWWGVGSVTGNLNPYAGSVIEVEDPEADAHLTVAEGFDLNGSLVFNHLVDQSLTVASGSLVTTATGSISTTMGPGSADQRPELHAEIVNHGLIDVDGLDLLISHPGAAHANQADGTIQVAGAELELDLGGAAEATSNFTNYGTTTVASGGRIRIVGSAGTQEVPSNFTNYGTTTVASGGSIRIIGAGGEAVSMYAVNAGTIELESDADFTVVSAGFENPASGRVRGSGTLGLTAASDVIFDGIFEPGLSPGILTLDGSAAVGSSTVFDLEIGGETAGTGHDRLDVTGDLGLDGTLDVALIDAYHPVGGERYQVITFDGRTGWFQQLTLPPLMHDLVWGVDSTEHDIGLTVSCQGTQLALEMVADRDPVSIGHEVIFNAVVVNASAVTATDVVLSGPLPAGLVYRPDLSSAECVQVGDAVECTVAGLAPSAVWQVAIAAEPLLAGLVETTGMVAAWECDVAPLDDQSTALFEAVAAEPCDANYDLTVDADDLVPAVGHIFGERAEGNPDCRPANGITADDLAAIIVAAQ